MNGKSNGKNKQDQKHTNISHQLATHKKSKQLKQHKEQEWKQPLVYHANNTMLSKVFFLINTTLPKVTDII